MRTSNEPFLCPDGYYTVKVPLRSIKFLDIKALETSILMGAGKERYAHYSELIKYGSYANGVPIVYRTPKGTLFASDLRHSDEVIYAEQHVKVNPNVPRDPLHPEMPVKIIPVTSREDIEVARAKYLRGEKPS